MLTPKAIPMWGVVHAFNQRKIKIFLLTHPSFLLFLTCHFFSALLFGFANNKVGNWIVLQNHPSFVYYHLANVKYCLQRRFRDCRRDIRRCILHHAILCCIKQWIADWCHLRRRWSPVSPSLPPSLLPCNAQLYHPSHTYLTLT